MLSAIVMNKYLRLIRIKQWIKNSIVFIPLIFSLSYKTPNLVLNALLMFAAFSLCASSVYIKNDIKDINEDKNHPKKRCRPLASGEIEISTASMISLIFSISSLIISYLINLKCLAFILLYIFVNYLYNKRLKFIPVIDVGCISAGFILRILAGCYAIGVEPSVYIILTTFFASLFFGFYKRILEINLDTKDTRGVLILYDKKILEYFTIISAALFIAFYTFYTVDSNVVQRLNTNYLYLSVFPVTYMLFRLLFLLNQRNENDDPSELFYTDIHINISIILYILTVALVIIA